MDAWVIALLTLIAAVLGIWVVWGNRLKARTKESDATRAKASFMLGLSLTVIYLVGNNV